MRIYVKESDKREIAEKERHLAERNGAHGAQKHNSHQAPSLQQRRGNGDDFDIAVREEMTRLEQKLQSMVHRDDDSVSSRNRVNSIDNDAYNNAYRNQHSVHKADFQIGFGNDAVTERAIKKAKQVEYKKQLDSFGNNRKGSNGRMRNRSVSPPADRSKQAGKRDNDRKYEPDSDRGGRRPSVDPPNRRRNRSQSPPDKSYNHPDPSRVINYHHVDYKPQHLDAPHHAPQGRGRRPSFDGNFEGEREKFDVHIPKGPGGQDYGGIHGHHDNGNGGNGHNGIGYGNGNGNNNGHNGYNPSNDGYSNHNPQRDSRDHRDNDNGRDRDYQREHNDYDRRANSPLANRSKDKNENQFQKSPTQARLRLVSDMYGASNVIGHDDNKVPVQWRPSMGQGDDYERKRKSGLEHKRNLDEQIAQDKKRKDDEKARERQVDDRAMEKMMRQHDEDRERERAAADAMRAVMRADDKRQADNHDKYSEDAIARHNKNMKIKHTPKKHAPSPARNSDQRKSPMNQNHLGRQGSGRRVESTPTHYSSKNTNPETVRRNSALDYQRALDEQIVDDRRRKEAEKEKEAADELNFMRAVRGGGYDGDIKEKARKDFGNSGKIGHSYSTSGKNNNFGNTAKRDNGQSFDNVDSIDQLKQSMVNDAPVKALPRRQSDASNDPRFSPRKENGRDSHPRSTSDDAYGPPLSPLARALAGSNSTQGQGQQTQHTQQQTMSPRWNPHQQTQSPQNRPQQHTHHTQEQPQAYSTQTSVASIMGDGPELNARKHNQQTDHNNNLRRAATPGGALECETQMTDSNTTLMFLQRPFTPQDNRFVDAPKDVNNFLERYDHENNYNRDFPNNRGRRKGQPTHPDYEQYESSENLNLYENQSPKKPSNDSLSYSMERKKSRKVPPRAIDTDTEDENDVSFVSDSKLLKIDLDSTKHKPNTERSMASESLLMYVGENSSKVQPKIPSRRPTVEIDSDVESPKNDSPSLTEIDDVDKIHTGSRPPSGSLNATSKPYSAQSTNPNTRPNSRPASRPDTGKAPQITRQPSPLASPLPSPLRDDSSPAEEAVITQDTTPRDDELCQWCFGAYWPCRCAEKGRNTSILHEKGNGSPPIDVDSESLQCASFEPRVTMKEPPERVSFSTGTSMSRQVSATNRTMKKISQRISAMHKPDAPPCKWCLGTFTPCYCEEGIPALDQADHISTDYYEDDENQQYDHQRKVNRSSIDAGNIDSGNNGNGNLNGNGIGAYGHGNGNRGAGQGPVNFAGSSKEMTSFQKRLASFTTANFDNDAQNSSYSYGNTGSHSNGNSLRQHGVTGSQSRNASMFAPNGTKIIKSKNGSMYGNSETTAIQEKLRWDRDHYDCSND